MFAAYCCGIFVPASLCFKIFQVSATECSKCIVVLLFRHNLIFVSPFKHPKHSGTNTAMGARRHAGSSCV